jgi:hypothetical protein
MLLRAFAVLCLVVGTATMGCPAAAADFDRAKVIADLAALLHTDYFDPTVGDAAAGMLASQAPSLEKETDRAKFAAAVTALLFSATHDKHLRLLDKPELLPELAASPEAAAEMERARDYGIMSVSILPGNIGCLALSGFARFTPDVAQHIGWAFDLLDGTYGLIIDLTASRGGDPVTEAELVGYLTGPDVTLDAAILRDGSSRSVVTPKTYAGPAYGKTRPVALAVSARTFSAAEALPYDLQALGRAQVFGEQTRGGGNPGRFVPLSDGFIAFMPIAHTVNPLTHTSWEGKGVTPDHAVDAQRAVETARLSLVKQLLQTETDPTRRAILEAGLAPPPATQKP